MKIEIEIDDARIRSAVESAARESLKGDHYGPGLSGSMAPYLTEVIHEQVAKAIDGMDLREIIAYIVQANLVPTVREAIKAELKIEAKKAVKEAMGERSA